MSATASPRRARMRLGLLVPAASALVLAAAMLAGAVVSERQARHLLVTQSRSRLALEAELLARASASAMLDGFPELTLQPILRDLMRGRNDLASARVLDRDGRVIADPDSRRIGHHEPLSVVTDGGAVVREDASNFVAVMPIRHANGQLLGEAIVVMPRAPLEHALAATRMRLWGVAALFVLVSATVMFALMSRLLRPLAVVHEGIERIAGGDLETRLALRDGTELGVLADTIDDMANRLSAAQKHQLERERLAAELEAAGRIQSSLHPPGGTVRRGPYAVTGYQRPAAEVGGDYFDAIELPDGRLGIVIADVSGKGLAGCLVTFMLAALVRVMREREASPSALLLEVDRYLRPVLERGAFVTVWYGVLDPLSGDLTFASAGHLPTVVRRADGRIETHESKGTPLGLLHPRILAKNLRDVTLRLAPGDLLLQLTDGFTEAARPGDDAQLGLDGVTAVLAESGAGEPEAFVARLCERTEAWTHGSVPDDDQTAIVVRRDPAPATARVPFADRDPSEWLARARVGGEPLRLVATFAELERLGPWIGAIPGMAALPADVQQGLESAVYEYCSNIMEHGYRLDGTGTAELWWVPAAAAPAAANAAPRVRGWLVIREDGSPFDPASIPAPDLSDRRARMRGRGLGLAMIRRLLPAMRYRPATSDGNVTLLEVDSDHLRRELEESPDARCA